MKSLINDQVFQKEYQQLNAKQKEAVDATEGPVMVVAGPGTGKTQILALRVCNILRSGTIDPQNILCLTFTDAATIAMRKRLMGFMGATAYDVPIYTYHAFANKIISENAQYFGEYRNLQALTELEEIDIYRDLIDSMSVDSPLKRFKSNVYFEQNRLKNLFKVMKQEAWEFDWFKDQIEKFRKEDVEEDPKKYIYQKTSKHGNKGEYKAAFKKHNEKCDKFIAAAGELPRYVSLLHKNERFDYQDMINWVNDALENNQELKLTYQEQFQYILADEYQDTNGSQNKLLMLLSDYWEKPNLFVVGDDDQSIYRFQGASMKNIVDFQKTYEPQIIVLENNYRSTQQILDAALESISNNEDRLVNKVAGLEKELIASRTDNLKGPVPKIHQYKNLFHEQAHLIETVRKWQAEGVNLKECAIMFSKHRQAEEVAAVLQKENIPIQLKRRINVLDSVTIKNLLNLLHLIDEVSRSSADIDQYLHPVMYMPQFGLNMKIMFLLNQQVYKKRDKTNLFLLMHDEEALAQLIGDDKEKVNDLKEIINGWVTKSNELTLQGLLELVLNESQMLDESLRKNDNYWSFQLIQNFFEHVKNVTAADPELHLKGFLENIIKMKENNLGIAMNQLIFDEEGVLLTTLHSAKGLEFEKVWMLGCTSDIWESLRSNNNSFNLPTSMMETNKDTEDDKRRLFYVGLTRAKKELIVSYSQKKTDESQKNLTPSKFVVEIQENNKTENLEINVAPEVISDYLTKRIITPEIPEEDWLDAPLINQALETFRMNPTSLNKYLQCPISFYYENILRVPGARSSSMGFGSAMHHALEMYLRDYQETKNLKPYATLKNFFEEGLRKYRSHFSKTEYQNNLIYGDKTLSGYYEAYHKEWEQIPEMLFEHKIEMTNYEGVPISGMLDRIDILDKECYVVDYKTGNPDSPWTSKKLAGPKDKNDFQGGDYWRQMVFYKILIDQDKRMKKKMVSGEMNMLEISTKKDKFIKTKFAVSPSDVETVKDQIKDTYTKILNHEFREGCNEENCKWCTFVKSVTS